MQMHDGGAFNVGDTVYTPDYIITNLQELLAILPDTSATNPKKNNFRSKTNARRCPYNRRVASLPDLESGNSNSSDGSWEQFLQFFFWSPFVIVQQQLLLRQSTSPKQLAHHYQKQSSVVNYSLIFLFNYYLLLLMAFNSSELISSNKTVVVIKIIFSIKKKEKQQI